MVVIGQKLSISFNLKVRDVQFPVDDLLKTNEKDELVFDESIYNSLINTKNDSQETILSPPDSNSGAQSVSLKIISPDFLFMKNKLLKTNFLDYRIRKRKIRKWWNFPIIRKENQREKTN